MKIFSFFLLHHKDWWWWWWWLWVDDGQITKTNIYWVFLVVVVSSLNQRIRWFLTFFSSFCFGCCCCGRPNKHHRIEWCMIWSSLEQKSQLNLFVFLKKKFDRFFFIISTATTRKNRSKIDICRIENIKIDFWFCEYIFFCYRYATI